MKFRTQSGSIYEVNYKNMTWRRLTTGNLARTSRKNSGKLVAQPGIVVGKMAYLQDDDLKSGCIAHFVTTSPVVQIYEEVPE